MSRSRRSVLKSMGVAGAAGAAATFPLGTAAAEEECAETVYTAVTDEAYPYGGLSSVSETLEDSGVTTPFAYSGAARGETGLGNQRCPPFDVPEDVFEDTDLPGRRIGITATWNPVDEGPSNFETFFQRRNFAGEFETIGYDIGDDGEMAENRFTISMVDGEQYTGIGPTQPVGEDPQTERNPIIVEGGQTYRHFVAARRGIVDFEIATEFVAFDPEC